MSESSLDQKIEMIAERKIDKWMDEKIESVVQRVVERKIEELSREDDDL